MGTALPVRASTDAGSVREPWATTTAAPAARWRRARRVAGASVDEPSAGTSSVAPSPERPPDVRATTSEVIPRAFSAASRSTANVSAPLRWVDVMTWRTSTSRAGRCASVCWSVAARLTCASPRYRSGRRWVLDCAGRSATRGGKESARIVTHVWRSMPARRHLRRTTPMARERQDSRDITSRSPLRRSERHEPRHMASRSGPPAAGGAPPAVAPSGDPYGPSPAAPSGDPYGPSPAAPSGDPYGPPPASPPGSPANGWSGVPAPSGNGHHGHVPAPGPPGPRGHGAPGPLPPPAPRGAPRAATAPTVRPPV